MKKTKTKRKRIITISLVALMMLAAIFYFLFASQDEELTPVVEDVQGEESILAEEKAKPIDNDSSIKDLLKEDVATEALEYTSEFYTVKNGFNAIGASWDELNAEETDISLYLRARNKSTTTQWYEVDKIYIEKKGNTTLYAAEAPVLIEGNEYQYRFIFNNPKNEVRNIKFNILNTMGALETNFFKKISNLFTGSAVASPSIISRSGWGSGAPNNTREELQAYADSNNIKTEINHWGAYNAAKTSKVVVHHTAGANNPSNPPAAVRAIWVYHTYSVPWYDNNGVKKYGWGDIGYHFLIDQHGKIYEGRHGGNHVVAGHAYGYNYDGATDTASLGVSVLGNFTSYDPNSNILNGLSNIIGHKSFQYNINPLGTSKYRDKTTYNIAGHRNYNSTGCPGDRLQARLPIIRTASDRIAMGHRILVNPDLTLTSQNTTEGQSVGASFIIHNNGENNLTLERLKIDVRDGSKIQDFGGFSNITIQPGSSYSFDQTRTMTSAGSYGATIRMRVNGNWYTPGSHSTKSLRVNPFDYSSIKLSKPLSFGANRYVGDELTANFELENTNSFVVNLARIKINFRKSGTATDFVGLSSQNVGAGGKLNFTDSIVPVSAGTYDARAVYNYNGRWAPLSSIVKVTINPSSIPAKIEASSLSIDNTSPMVGERLGASFYLTNNNSQAVTLSRVKIDVRGSGSAQDIVGVNNLTIQPGSSAKVKLEGDDFARYLASSGSFTGTIRFNYAGSWYTPGGGDRFSLGISVFDPSNVVVSPRLNLEPSSLLVSSEATASFGISYARPYKVRLERLKIDVRDGIKSQDFSGESGFILNPEQYSFNQSRVITERGTYACNVRIRVAGKWYSPSGQASSSLSVF
jgi:P pilus assembly chaperone PapD